MPWGTVLVWGLVVGGAVAALYGLHRLCLWLEERGWLYYKHKKPSSSPAGCLVALQKALEPQTRHVLEIRDEKHHRADQEAPGEDDPFRSDTDDRDGSDRVGGRP